MTTLSDAWLLHADRTLTGNESGEQIRRAQRDWYYAQLERLDAIPNRSAQEEALFREALGFGRAIGTKAEAATT